MPSDDGQILPDVENVEVFPCSSSGWSSSLAWSPFAENAKYKRSRRHRPKVVLLGTGTPSTAIVVDDRAYLIDFGPGVVPRRRNSRGLREQRWGSRESGPTPPVDTQETRRERRTPRTDSYSVLQFLTSVSKFCCATQNLVTP